MTRARLSGPPAVEPIVIPANDYQYEMTAREEHEGQNAEQEPISPLSPRSEALLLRQKNSVRRMSPFSSNADVQPSIRGRQPAPMKLQPSQRRGRQPPRESYPPANVRNVPPRKPVNGDHPACQGAVVAQVPIVISSRPHHSIRPEHDHHSRPRSQSFQAIPDTFLQDYAAHASPAPALISMLSQPSRSQSVPSQSSRQTCAHCGKAQNNCPTKFLCCKTCRGVYYCSMPCWENRVCHRSVKCTVCDCTQASSSVDFQRCKKCMQIGKEFWYCSDECWDQRNCHVRSDQLPPEPPAKVRMPYRQEFREQRQVPEGSNTAHQSRTRRLQGRRDLEAQRAKDKRTPYHQRTGYSATVWACFITFILLCIFVPIIAVFGSKAH